MKNRKISFILVIFFFIIPIVLVFRPFFSSNHLAWGDAPFFTSDGMVELMRENYLWTTRGTLLGGINQFIWIYPLMFVWGALHQILGLGNDIIIRLLFYFPSLLLGVASSYIFARKLKISSTASILVSIFYVFNTYYLLLVDGGQVGVALAYGIFPLSLLTLINLWEKSSTKYFWVALITNFCLSIVDPRIFVVSLLTFLLWLIVSVLKDKKAVTRKSILVLFLLISAWAGLNSYWIIPTILTTGVGDVSVSSLQLVSLLNTLLLHQPHWPQNVFGVIAPPPPYFSLMPVLLFGVVVLQKNKKYLSIGLIVLVLAFLAKGDTPPFGQIYSFAIEKIPFGVILRDSTKFYIPLLLWGGVLFSRTAEVLSKKLGLAIYILFVAYLLVLVHPALLGRLNFVLSGRSENKIEVANKFIQSQNGSFKVAWFPERHPLSIDTSTKQALDARDLVNLVPLNNLNVGDYDKFNYLHKPEYIAWYRLLGIKYLVLSGDPRKASLTAEENENWEDLSDRIATSSGLLKKDIGEVSVYEIANTKPSFLAAKKAVVVVGGTELQTPLVPMLYVEDGKFDTNALVNISSQSAVLYFENRTDTDLAASLLKKHFKDINQARSSMWAKWDYEQNLKWKFEALIRGVEIKDLDYNLPVATSEVTNETINFEFEVPENGEYVLLARTLGKKENDNLAFSLNGKNWNSTSKEQSFKWDANQIFLPKGKHVLEAKNSGGFWILNTLALVPVKDWLNAQQQVRDYKQKFSAITKADLDKMALTDNWESVDFNTLSAVNYEVSLKENYPWILMSQSYHPAWLADKREGVSFYGSLNGFYINQTPKVVKIEFADQIYVRWGVYFTVLALVTLIISFLYSLR